MEKLKDFIYDQTDLLLGAVVFFIMIFMLTQTFSVFDRGILSILRQDARSFADEEWEDYVFEEEPEPEDDGEDPIASDDVESDDASEDIEELDDDLHSEDDDSEIEEDDSTDEGSDSAIETVEVIIPEGSMPHQIGAILEEKNLIESTSDFILKLIELDADRRLRPGKFDFPKPSTIEEIIDILTP